MHVCVTPDGAACLYLSYYTPPGFRWVLCWSCLATWRVFDDIPKCFVSCACPSVSQKFKLLVIRTVTKFVLCYCYAWLTETIKLNVQPISDLQFHRWSLWQTHQHPPTQLQCGYNSDVMLCHPCQCLTIGQDTVPVRVQTKLFSDTQTSPTMECTHYVLGPHPQPVMIQLYAVQLTQWGTLQKHFCRLQMLQVWNTASAKVTDWWNRFVASVMYIYIYPVFRI